MELSDKYILTDEWLRPIPPKYSFGHSYCKICGDFFIKNAKHQRCCNIDCSRYNAYRKKLEKKFKQDPQSFSRIF